MRRKKRKIVVRRFRRRDERIEWVSERRKWGRGKGWRKKIKKGHVKKNRIEGKLGKKRWIE